MSWYQNTTENNQVTTFLHCPPPFLSLNRYLIYNQNIGIKNIEISAQKLHIHCLFWKYISQIQKAYGSQRHVKRRYCLQKGVGALCGYQEKRQSQTWGRRMI